MPRSTTSTRPTRDSRTAGKKRPVKRARTRGGGVPITAKQVRELAAVALLLLGALSILAMAGGTAGPLAGFRHILTAQFGTAWFIPTTACLIVGGWLVWPVQSRAHPLEMGGGVAAAAAAIGLFGLLGRSGGSIGGFIATGAVGLAGGIGGTLLLIALLLVGVILAFRFSPGELLAALVAAVQSAYDERQRLRSLVPAKPAEIQPKLRKEKPPQAAPAPSKTEEGTEPAWLIALRQEEDLRAEPKPEGKEEAKKETKAKPAPAPKSTDAPGQMVLDTEAPVAPQPPSPSSATSSTASSTASSTEESPPPVMRVVAEREDDEPAIAWQLPSVGLLDSVTARRERMEDEIKRNVRIIESTLETFGVAAKVIGVNPGPAVTQYELQPGEGVQVKRITSLHNDLSLALAASPLRMEAPIPGKSAVGIEVPNKSASLVSIREVVETPAFGSGQALALALGNDVSGAAIVGDLTRMPNLLIAGATGQGKSVCVNVLIASMLLRNSPSELRFIMIDPKRVELSNYNGLPHLALPVLVEAHQAAAALRWAVAEMDRRYKLFAHEGVRTYAAYNEKAASANARPLPRIVIVIDELADLMMVAAGEIEELVCRIAQLARAVAIHLVIATQRPSTDVITGLIKANIPSRIAFAVSSQVDSRVILDEGGAEKLLGRGDMLYKPIDAAKPSRLQGAFISDPEIDTLLRFWKAQSPPRYMEEILDVHGGAEPGSADSERRLDPLFARAARAVAAEGAASVSLVQRKFNVGYSRAGRIVDQLAVHRVIGEYQGSKPRDVLMNLPDVDELMERLGLE